MGNKLKPYEVYKETEYDWLGPVPSHWQEHTVRSITKLSSERNGTRDDLELLSVYREYGVIRKSSRDDNHNVESQDLSNYKFVDVGYLVLNKMKMWQGSLGVSKYKGIVSPAYIVCRLLGDLNSDYVHYLMRSAKFKTIYNRISYGVRVGQWDMRYDDFKNIKLFLPPIAEQNQIVKYLDNQLEKINKFIKVKKELIAVLKEQKQAVINDAVTRGTRFDINYKQSSISWIKEIPEHWEFRALKRLTSTKMSDGPHETPVFVDKGVPFVSAEAVYNGKINLDSMRGYISEEDHRKYCEKLKPQRNDIFIVKSGSTTGKSCIVDFDEEFSVWSPLALVRSNEENDPYFLFYAINATYFQEQVQDKWSFGTQPNIGMGILQNLLIATPPLDEQQSIVQFLNNEIERIDSIIEAYEKEINLINEYRVTLISEVVTGKYDVRYVENQNQHI
ncbi:restriction endonuclease subunit S [Cytobacillus solani]|uniref:restriction endonuclease subunit S n=1 Tax=Cytobacillus solani TaxID=1637975 RepID=UPI00114F90C5|nr:restriction endonuclease subunit S [Cytobacillus solani]USK56257.1 restriction endonuclease subunit S [Cytobacillus solani]